jgi:hypothetical protein
MFPSDFTFVARTNKTVGYPAKKKKKLLLLAPLFFCALAIAHRCCSYAFVVTMGFSSTSAGSFPVL